MPRPSSITLKIDKKELKVEDTKIKQLLKSTVRPNSSGGYIPMSQEYNDHEVFVVVMEKKNGRKNSH